MHKFAYKSKFFYLCSMDFNYGIYARSNPDIIKELGRRFKDYRLNSNITQKELSEQSGVSLITIRQFENGHSTNITMANFLALLRSVKCLENVNELMPEIPISGYVMEKILKNKPKRASHARAKKL